MKNLTKHKQMLLVHNVQNAHVAKFKCGVKLGGYMLPVMLLQCLTCMLSLLFLFMWTVTE